MIKKCLYCYEKLSAEENDFHKTCIKKFFGTDKVPQISYKLSDIKKLALENLIVNTSVTGVQPKLSLDIPKEKNKKIRFTITGLWGYYILKPPVEIYPEMPEIEDLTMKIAATVKIKTAEHSLIRLGSGELAYITKRFDRKDGDKIHVEDMAQITGVLTEHKYRSSMEKVGKAIRKYSSYPGADLITFYELTLMSFLTGNADMHLKNFSLIRTDDDDEMMLAPAYDLLSTKMLLKEDLEEMALTLNGKKNRLNKIDFTKFAMALGLNETSVNNSHEKIFTSIDSIEQIISKSFLSVKKKSEYIKLIKERVNRLK